MARRLKQKGGPGAPFDGKQQETPAGDLRNDFKGLGEPCFACLFPEGRKHGHHPHALGPDGQWHATGPNAPRATFCENGYLPPARVSAENERLRRALEIATSALASLVSAVDEVPAHAWDDLRSEGGPGLQCGLCYALASEAHSNECAVGNLETAIDVARDVLAGKKTT